MVSTALLGLTLPVKQGVVVLCSCDNTDVNVENMGFALMGIPMDITSIH